ncbi:ATP-binding cassette domain-containing protein [Neobacillus sp. YIM B06451]|uniref:ABC transporter ATP-binding protein n=1 Tax=Neobacillus sp. YIM B06451 TaxID=3070994 RepID=UPI002930CB81|nr:ATP-binding cassette domain-containing protein [Neobacillus sp. YIM B06451]
MNASIINVKNVKRTYVAEQGFFKKKKKTIEALKGISFEVQKGEVFGLLGPNGAGKTTMIKILTTMLIPTEGQATILGLDVETENHKLRTQINFILGGERNLYWRLSAYDNLTYFADLYKIPRSIQKERIPELLKLVGLENAAAQRVETFSKGMKQRLQIARGLINDPKILFLDEPSIGLDPISARNLRQIIRQLNENGTTIVLTTHYMQEADELCDRIAFINQGELIAIDTPDNLKKMVGQLSVVQFDCTSGVKAKSLLIKNASLHHLEETSNDYYSTVRVQTSEPQKIISLLYSGLGEGGIQNISITEPSLEDVYLHLIGGLKDEQHSSPIMANS